MGRHSAAPVHHQPATPDRPRSRRRFIIGIISGAVVVVLLAVAGVAWGTGALKGILPSPANALGCDKPTQLRVVADPAIAPALTKSAMSFDAVTPCVTTTVRAQTSAETASIVASGNDPKADVWIPDSPGWEARIAATAKSLGRGTPKAFFGVNVATTPMIFAAPAKQADSLAAAKPAWSSIYGGTVSALLPDPVNNGASLLALSVLKSNAPAGNPLAFDAAMIAIGKVVPTDPTSAFTDAVKASTPTVVLTTEQAVFAHNESEKGSDQQFFAVYPSSGTVLDSYPYVRLAGATSGSAAKDRLLNSLERAFVTDTKHMAQYGFRSGIGMGSLKATGVLASYTNMLSPDLSSQVDLLHAWSTITMRSRMLAVVDVSGSMNEDAGGGMTRIGIFQQAAMGAVSMFSPQAELGIWIFSTNQNGSTPYREMTPIAPIGDPAHQEAIAGIIGALPSYVQGDTGLYDTVLAAVKDVQKDYSPGMVNSVLVITDGKNDNPGGGLSLQDLLSQLKTVENPDKPVEVIMIGFGPDTDLAAMSQIADATDGGVYTATKPQDLGNVLVDALSQRSCRPNCLIH
ncbi:VWA domain-containing protein [Rathayibacter sp. CAU 1779]